MNKSSALETVNKEFNIHDKLRAAKTHWSYCFAAQLHDESFNYQFRTNFVDGMEFAVYERIETYFILVDFFKSYDEACEHAKKIIDTYPDIKQMVEANQLTN